MAFPTVVDDVTVVIDVDSPSHSVQKEIGPPLLGGCRLRCWLGPLLQAPICGCGRLSLYPRNALMPVPNCLTALLVLVPYPTLPAALASVKGMTRDICPKSYIEGVLARICTGELRRTFLLKLYEKAS